MNYSFNRWLRRKRIIKKSDRWIHSFTLPGFNGIPVWDVLAFVRVEIRNDAINVRAAAVAFNFLLAIFPAIIFLFTLIAYMPGRGYQDSILLSIKAVMPKDAYPFIKSTIEDIVRHQRGGLLSLGLLFTLYYASNGVRGLMNAFSKAHAHFRKRKRLNKQWVAVKITFLIFVLVMISVVMIVLNKWLVGLFAHWFHFKSAFSFNILYGLNWIVLIGLCYFAISTLYFFGPATRMRWKFFNAGSTVATIMSVITSLAFATFINNFNQFNKLYGSIGTLLILMIWMYWNSWVILFGFELNSSIDYHRQKTIET